jgi:hypothetical protein
MIDDAFKRCSAVVKLMGLSERWVVEGNAFDAEYRGEVF